MIYPLHPVVLEEHEYLLFPVVLEEHEELTKKPKTRRECAGIPRPCPFVSCKYHLFLDIESNAHIYNLPIYKDPSDMPMEASCQLDIAERVGELTDAEVGAYLGMTETQVATVLSEAVRKLRHHSSAETLDAIQDDFLDLDHIEDLSDEK